MAELSAGGAVRPPPGAARDWTIAQNWRAYSAAEHAVWDQLYAAQARMLPNRVVAPFMAGLERLGMSKPGIPDFEELSQRLQAATGPEFNRQRLLEEVAVLVERSDISEEIARMHTHIGHFRELLAANGEVGKKLDFLLQEMNREANTLLSKTGGLGGKGTRVTELGLAMKAEIEKAREQIQNVE